MGFFSRDSSERKEEKKIEKAREKEEKRVLKLEKKQRKEMEKEEKKRVKLVKKQEEKEIKQALALEKQVEKERKRALKEEAKQQSKEMKLVEKQEKRIVKDRVKQEKKHRKQEKKIRKQERKQIKVQLKQRKKVMKRQKKQDRKIAKQEKKQAKVRAQEIAKEEKNMHKPPRKIKTSTCIHCQVFFTERLLRSDRIYCRQCGNNCCKSCMSVVKRPLIWYGLKHPQKVCLQCEVQYFGEGPGLPSQISYNNLVAEEEVLPPLVDDVPVPVPTEEEPVVDSPNEPQNKERKRSKRSWKQLSGKWPLKVLNIGRSSSDMELKQPENGVFDWDIHRHKAEQIAYEHRCAMILISNHNLTLETPEQVQYARVC